ncbi:MAG: hypothetical protein ACOZBZ_04565 [Patescibacteria group bacterium]
MLTKKDLQEINELIKRQIEEAVAQISRAITKALENVATKEDLENLATKKELKMVEERLERVETDVRDIKRDVSDLKADMPTKEEFKTLRKLEEIHQKELATYA